MGFEQESYNWRVDFIPGGSIFKAGWRQKYFQLLGEGGKTFLLGRLFRTVEDENLFIPLGSLLKILEFMRYA